MGISLGCALFALGLIPSIYFVAYSLAALQEWIDSFGRRKP